MTRTILMVLLLAAGAQAQIELVPSKPSYAPGEPVEINLINHGGTTIDFPAANWWRIVDVFGGSVFTFSGPPAVRPLFPGEALREFWFQVDDIGFPTLLGPYIIEASFVDTQTGALIFLTQSIGVGGPPDPNVIFQPVYIPPPTVVVIGGGGVSVGCGSVGIDLLLLPGILWVWRRRLRRI